MKNAVKGNIIKATGLSLDVVPPLAATISQFPVWVNKSGDATVSGLFVVMAFLCCIPFMKQIKAWLKSPSVWGMWCVILVVLIALRAIINEMLAVCFVGAISNICGAAIYKYGEIVEARKDQE